MRVGPMCHRRRGETIALITIGMASRSTPSLTFRTLLIKEIN